MLKQQISELTTVRPGNASHVGFCLTGEGLLCGEMCKKMLVHISGVLLINSFEPGMLHYWSCRKLSTVMEGP